jgi:hypothetical protein
MTDPIVIRYCIQCPTLTQYQTAQMISLDYVSTFELGQIWSQRADHTKSKKDTQSVGQRGQSHVIGSFPRRGDIMNILPKAWKDMWWYILNSIHHISLHTTSYIIAHTHSI